MNILGFMASPLGYCLEGIYQLVGNYGISLIILTFVVKIILYPFYKRQTLSTVGVSDITPKINAIRNKYASDPTRMNEEISKLYREEGVSPTAGCLPMLIQMIVIFGLFALLRNPLNYVNSEEMVFAIHENFLWIQDLSQPDPWILPILSGVTTFVAFYMNTAKNGMMGAQNSAMGNSRGMTIVMRYFFPLMIIWLAKTYAAGLAIYWFLSQFIQIFFNMRFNYLRKKMLEERAQAKIKKRKPVRAGQGVR